MTYYQSRFNAHNWNASRAASPADDQRSEKLVDLSTEVHQLHVELNTLLKCVTERAVAAWNAAGGCQTCLGYGTVVTWATLDGRGYTETGNCETCGGKSTDRQPGARIDGWFVYGVPGELSVDALTPENSTQAERALAYTYEMCIAELVRDIDDETEHCIVEKGKTVIVFKGRKVPLGTSGECFWTGDKGYGLRVGIRDAAGEVHWTAASNVKVAA